MNNKLKVKLLHPLAKTPDYAYQSAGYDLRCLDYIILTELERKVELPRHVAPNTIIKIPLGFATEMTPTHVGIIKDKSGLAIQGFSVMGGVIDSDYRGEWIVLIKTFHKMVTLTPGMKIAQVLFFQVEKPFIEVVDKLSESLRGGKGFGSSNK